MNRIGCRYRSDSPIDSAAETPKKAMIQLSVRASDNPMLSATVSMMVRPTNASIQMGTAAPI